MTGETRDRFLLAALAASALALLWRFQAEPFHHGYTRYAGLAAEMLRSGDWLVMRAAGHPYFNKPPLYAWLIAAPMTLLGRTSGFAQHVPDAVAFAVALGFVWAFARRWFDERSAGPCAALVLATSLGFQFLMRGKRVDPLFTAWLTGAFYFAWRALEADAARRERVATTLVSYLLLALAVLTKGPLALVFYTLVIVPYAIWRRRPGRLMAPENLAGLALLLAIVGVWLAFVIREIGVEAMLTGFGGVRAGRLGPALYYLTLPVRLLPWSLLLPALAVFVWRARPQGRSAPSASLAFLLFWLAGVLLPLQFSHARHFRYALPAFPAFALLVVALWYHPAAASIRAQGGPWGERLATAPLLLLLGAAVLAAVLSPLALVVHEEWRDAAPFVALPLAGAGLAGFSGLRRLLRAHDARAAFERAVLAVSLAFVAADAAATAHLDAKSKRSAAALEALVPIVRGGPVLGYRLSSGAWSDVLLASGVSVESCSSTKEVVAWLRALPKGQGWVVTSRKARKGILANRDLVVRGAPIEQAGVVLISVSDPARGPP